MAQIGSGDKKKAPPFPSWVKALSPKSTNLMADRPYNRNHLQAISAYRNALLPPNRLLAKCGSGNDSLESKVIGSDGVTCNPYTHRAFEQDSDP